MSSSQTKGMIFLETGHPILEEHILRRISPGAKPESADITCSDFDGVRYRVYATSDGKSIEVDVAMPFYSSIRASGADAIIDSMYGAYAKGSPPSGYDLRYEIPTEGLTEKPEDVAKKFSEIKRNLTGAPFKKCFDALLEGKSGSLSPIVIPFRPNETIVLVPGADRINIYFTIDFADEADKAIAKVFLQEFSECQRKIPRAPGVQFTLDCPSDLAKVASFRDNGGHVGYVMFQVFKSHVEGNKMDKSITLFQGFRQYLHYHIKASKSHLHARMRKRVELLLQVLKRADPDTSEASKKAYRTY